MKKGSAAFPENRGALEAQTRKGKLPPRRVDQDKLRKEPQGKKGLTNPLNLSANGVGSWASPAAGRKRIGNAKAPSRTMTVKKNYGEPRKLERGGENSGKRFYERKS